LLRCQAEWFGLSIRPLMSGFYDCLRQGLMLLPEWGGALLLGYCWYSVSKLIFRDWAVLVHTPYCTWLSQTKYKVHGTELQSPGMRLHISESLCGISKSDPGYMVTQKLQAGVSKPSQPYSLRPVYPAQIDALKALLRPSEIWAIIRLPITSSSVPPTPPTPSPMPAQPSSLAS
jgi:hypothetical protein